MKTSLYFALLSSLLLSGCQVINMVSVKQVDLSKSLSSERASILTDDSLSHASHNTLMMINPKTKTCINTPDECMQSFQNIPELGDEQILSTGSELYLSHALQLKDKKECQAKYYQTEKDEHEKSKKQQQFQQCSTQYLEALNQSIRYSYAYLFATQRKPEQRLFNNRQIQVKDFYNQAIAHLLNYVNEYRTQQIDYKSMISVGHSLYKINISQYPALDLEQIEQLVSTYNLQFNGLNSLARRDGFGSEFVIKLKRPDFKNTQNIVNYGKQKIDIFHHPNVHLGEYLPATVIIEPQQKDNIHDILTSKQFELRVINPNKFVNIELQKQPFQLAANFSAPYGLWLANSKMGSLGLNTMLKQDEGFISPQLFMLEPYNPNKKIIIMIHGLASSPEAWIATSNDMMSDPILRENYQIWQVFYSTNIPIFENRYQIYHLLEQTLSTLQQKYPQSQQDIVLIGHSMGGIISRLLVSQDDLSPRVLSYIQKKCKDCRKENHIISQIIAQNADYLKLNSLTPKVKRSVFISAPLKGTDYADKWFTQTARKLIKLPLTFTNATIEHLNYQFNDENVKFLNKELKQNLLQNGASNLSPKSTFMYITHDVKIVQNLPYHVIVGNNTKSNDKTIMTDGIVPYLSSHLDGAISEKIIEGGHSIQYTPEAVLELRRILHLHLQDKK